MDSKRNEAGVRQSLVCSQEHDRTRSPAYYKSSEFETFLCLFNTPSGPSTWFCLYLSNSGMWRHIPNYKAIFGLIEVKNQEKSKKNRHFQWNPAPSINRWRHIPLKTGLSHGIWQHSLQDFKSPYRTHLWCQILLDQGPFREFSATNVSNSEKSPILVESGATACQDLKNR